MSQSTLTALQIKAGQAVSNSVVTLTTLAFSTANLQSMDQALLTVETANIRVTFDGTTPDASTGHLYASGNSYWIVGCDLLRAMKMIRATGSDASVTITLFKR